MEIAQDKLISMNTNILEEISVQGIPEKQILEGRFILKKRIKCMLNLPSQPVKL